MNDWHHVSPFFHGFCETEFKEEGIEMADEEPFILKWMTQSLSVKNGEMIVELFLSE